MELYFQVGRINEDTTISPFKALLGEGRVPERHIQRFLIFCSQRSTQKIADSGQSLWQGWSEPMSGSGQNLGYMQSAARQSRPRGGGMT